MKLLRTQISVFFTLVLLFFGYTVFKKDNEDIENASPISLHKKVPEEPIDPVEFYTIVTVIAVLVLIGGIFAGTFILHI